MPYGRVAHALIIALEQPAAVAGIAHGPPIGEAVYIDRDLTAACIVENNYRFQERIKNGKGRAAVAGVAIAVGVVVRLVGVVSTWAVVAGIIDAVVIAVLLVGNRRALYAVQIELAV